MYLAVLAVYNSSEQSHKTFLCQQEHYVQWGHQDPDTSWQLVAED